MGGANSERRAPASRGGLNQEVGPSSCSEFGLAKEWGGTLPSPHDAITFIVIHRLERL